MLAGADATQQYYWHLSGLMRMCRMVVVPGSHFAPQEEPARFAGVVSESYRLVAEQPRAESGAGIRSRL